MLKSYQNRINEYAKQQFAELLALNSRVSQAIEYSFFNGGKRIRPALVYALSDSLQKQVELSTNQIDAVALAIECIHAYSLIHDDLPAIDDDDLRRGKLSCHKAFDEATAILAGDGLNTLAFEVLAKTASPSALKQIEILSNCAGCQGMILGQDMDIQAENAKNRLTLEQLKILHDAKTGKLIQACFLMVISPLNLSKEQQQKIRLAAKHLGVIYQIQDDILDITQTTEILGKPSQSDEKNNKSTYVSLLGIEQATAEKNQLSQQMFDLFNQAIPNFSKSPLNDIVTRLLARNH